MPLAVPDQLHCTSWEILSQQDLFRIIRSLLASELAASRCQPRNSLPWRVWSEATPLDESSFGAGLDSLDLLRAAAALNEMFHLHETGIEDYLLARRTLQGWVATVTASLARKAERISFRTSGSTGEPRRCTHLLSSLIEEADYFAAAFPGRSRLVSLVPPHHIYGFLWTVLLPQRAGIPVLDLDGAVLSAPSQLQPGDLVVGTPAHWEFFSRSGLSFPTGVEGVVSTAPCPATLAGSLHSLGLTRLTEVYGSSETGGIGCRDDAAEPFRLLPYWSRYGRTEGALLRRNGGEWVPTEAPDRLEWFGPDQFLPAGRLDSAVQVGGVNVYPDRIRDVLLRHPAVADCAVRLMRPDEGSRLKAFLVLHQGFEESWASESIPRWLRDRLPAPERPVSFLFGSSLPRNEMGKLMDWECRC